MSERPSFAVVIPTYNRAQRLLGTLETVFDQDEPAAEIIVVDDCSTDDTRVVVQELARRHPTLRYVRHDANLERAAARNTGMSNTTADYVTFLDSDDRMYPQNLLEAGNFVVATSAKFFHNRCRSVDESGTHLRNWPVPRLGNHLRAFAEGNFPACIGVFIHRDIYTAYEFDTAPVLTGAEDYDFWLRIAADYPIGRIDRINSAVVEHAGRSMLNQDMHGAEKRVGYILDKVHSDPHLRQAYGPYLARMRAGRMVFLAIFANDSHRPWVALAYLWRAVSSYPIIAASRRFVRCLQLATWKAIRSPHEG